MDCILLVGPEANPLRWLLWHCHTTSNDAIHLPLGKCNVKSGKIQTIHDFREKHNVSKTRTNLNQRAMQIFSIKSQNAKSKWNMDYHPTSLKWKANWIMFDDATLLFSLLSKDQTNSANTALTWRGVLPLATSMLQYSAHRSPQDCKSCIQVWNSVPNWTTKMRKQHPGNCILDARVPISLFHWQIRMMQIYPISTIDGVLDFSQDISHFKTIQFDWWNHNHVAHIITRAIACRAYSSPLSRDITGLSSSRNLRTSAIWARHLSFVPRGMLLQVWRLTWYNSSAVGVNLEFEISAMGNLQFTTSLKKLWASHMYVQIWYESQILEKKRHNFFKTKLKSNPLLHLHLCKTHFLFSLPTWNPDEMILETYAPESSCQSPLICKDLQHSSRSWTRRGGHMRSGHPRWSGHSRRRTLVVSGGSGGGNPYPGIGMLPSPDIGVIGVPDGGQTRRWHWLSRIQWSTSTLGCYSSPPRCHLLISLGFCPLKFLLCFRMLVFQPFGFDRNWMRRALCRPLFLHHSFQTLHSFGDLVRQGCKVNWISFKDLGQVSIHRGNQAASLAADFTGFSFFASCSQLLCCPLQIG